MGHPMRLELIQEGLQEKLANRYTNRGALSEALRNRPLLRLLIDSHSQT